MDKNTAWLLFEKTGSIEAYQLYKDEHDEQEEILPQDLKLVLA